MNKLRDFLSSIHGGVYITIFIIVAASQLEPIMEFLHKRKLQVERNRNVEVSKRNCYSSGHRVSISQRIQSCLSSVKFANQDGRKDLVNRYTEQACKLGSVDSCYKISLTKQGPSKISYLDKACRDGAGGIMLACGELGLLTNNQELLGYACKNDLKKFCIKTP